MTTGKEVATIQGSGGLALRGDQLDWTEAQRAALAQIGIDKAPAGDQQVFLHVAQRVGLDPFARQIYLIGRKDDEAPGGKKWTIQTAIDGFRVFSERHPQYAGDGDAEWCGEDEVWREMWVSDQPPKAARFTVYRHDRPHPIRAVAHYSEYVVTKYNGQPNHIWKTKPAGQLAKCAEALAKRRAFPQDLSSIYTDEEMEHVDNPPPVVIQAERVRADEPAEPDWDDELAQRHGDPERLKELLDLARGIRRNDGPLLNKISQAWQDARTAAAKPPPAEPTAAPKPPNTSRRNRLFGLLDEAGAKTSEKRHRLASHALDRDITSFTDLSAADVEYLITRLEELKAEGKFPAAAAQDTPTEQPTQPADTQGDQQ